VTGDNLAGQHCHETHWNGRRAVTWVYFGKEGFVFEPAFLPKKEKEGNQSLKITMSCVCVM
jgi:hypothetical protein